MGMGSWTSPCEGVGFPPEHVLTETEINLSSDLDVRLKEAISKRDRLLSDSARISGRKDAADNALREVETEIRSKKLDPDTLDQTIASLEEAYAAEVTSLEEAVDRSRQELTPYMEPTR